MQENKPSFKEQEWEILYTFWKSPYQLSATALKNPKTLKDNLKEAIGKYLGKATSTEKELINKLTELTTVEVMATIHAIKDGVQPRYGYRWRIPKPAKLNGLVQ